MVLPGLPWIPEPPTLALIGVAAAFVAWRLHRMRRND